MTTSVPSLLADRAPRSRRVVRLLHLVPAVSLLLGCAAITGSSSTSSRFRGGELSSPVPLPAVTLTDTAGKTVNLQAAVKGAVAVVYFGYTNCPDVCPTTMADLGTAIRKLPASEQQRVQVVFITTDPQHDTHTRLRAWLDNFDAGLPHPFIGLGGDLKTVQATAAKFGVVAESPQTDGGGKVTDTHGAQVIAFSPSDEQGRVVWLPGTKVADYAHDFRVLLST